MLERRVPSRRVRARQAAVALCPPTLHRGGVPSALQGRGWRVEEAEWPASATGADVLVLGLLDAKDEALLLAAEEQRRAGSAAELVVLAAAESEALRRWVLSLTPYLYPWPMGAEALALALDGVRERLRGRPAAVDAAERTVTLRLWESVEVDGREIYLGSAERNFLFDLASQPGHRISKHEPVDAGAGRVVEAVECRRRLGRRLGSELTSLLVPAVRREPYRFREQDEVTAVCIEEGLALTRTRVIGRGEVRMAYTDRIEALAGSGMTGAFA